MAKHFFLGYLIEIGGKQEIIPPELVDLFSVNEPDELVKVYIEKPKPKPKPKPVSKRPIYQYDHTTGIAEAVRRAGSQAALAEELGVSAQYVGKCCKRGYISKNHFVHIESVYGVPRKDLCKPEMAKFFNLPQEKYGTVGDFRAV